MKVALLVNPSASSVSPTSQVMVARQLSQQHDVEILLTNERGHATELTQQVAKGDADTLIVYGGDGTLNEVANGLVGYDMALGVLPGGSTNVFSRIIGLDDDPIVAVEQTLRALLHKNFVDVPVGDVNERRFLFHAGVGFDARVVQKVEDRADLKRWMAHTLFAYKAFTTWLWNYNRKSPHFTVEFSSGENEAESVSGFFTVCLNANPYTYLGSRPLNLVEANALKKNLSAPVTAPKHTGFNDGFVVTTATQLQARDLIRFVRRALSKKRSLKEDSEIDYRPSITNFRIYSEKEFPYQADGDFLGYTNELYFRHLVDGLRLLMPLKL